ncbi:hypothetical protein KPATCC21470_7478 [Kitasatospora purpeofusca]
MILPWDDLGRGWCDHDVRAVLDSPVRRTGPARPGRVDEAAAPRGRRRAGPWPTVEAVPGRPGAPGGRPVARPHDLALTD